MPASIRETTGPVGDPGNGIGDFIIFAERRLLMNGHDGNVAFKCTYNDGGDRGFVGFGGTCSNGNIFHNVKTSPRRWCSSPSNLCRRFCGSKFGPLRRSKSRPVGEGVAVFVGRLERSLRSPFRAAQA